jgi:hypothetical protein
MVEERERDVVGEERIGFAVGQIAVETKKA